jgi:hypothetical protein
VVRRAHLHWIIFATPALFAAFGIAMLASSDHAVAGYGVILLLVSGVVGLLRLIEYRSSEFAVTDRRVLVKVGFIRRNSLELLLGRSKASPSTRAYAGGYLVTGRWSSLVLAVHMSRTGVSPLRWNLGNRSKNRSRHSWFPRRARCKLFVDRFFGAGSSSIDDIPRSGVLCTWPSFADQPYITNYRIYAPSPGAWSRNR